MQIALQASLARTKNKKNLNLQRGLEGNFHVHKRITNSPQKAYYGNFNAEIRKEQCVFKKNTLAFEF